YARAVSLNRLYLAMRASGFSRIAVYTGGKLSHAVADTQAGMMVQRGMAPAQWISTPVGNGAIVDFMGWPAWRAQAPPPLALMLDAPRRPTVSFVFPAAQQGAIEIAVPVEGAFEQRLSDFIQPVFRLVSDLTIAEADGAREGGRAEPKSTVAMVVFDKRIDRAMLDALAARSGKLPLLLSPDGAHQLRLTAADLLPRALLRRALAGAGNPHVLEQTVAGAGGGEFYVALLPWQYERQPRLILGMAASREPTLRNIGQTVGAILLTASLIMALCIGVGIFWVGRFIDPIVALTRAVKQIGVQRGLGGAPDAPRQAPIAVSAPDEIGELGAAFNVMTAELRRAFDTLEQRVQHRTAELRQQTRYLRTLIDTLPLSVWLKDTEGRYLATNQANADACGHPVAQMVGHTDEQLWPAALAARYDADDREVLRTRQRKTVEEALPGPGGLAWIETWRAPVLDEDGSALGTVGVARNVSERKWAEQAREAALAEAVRLARMRSEFLAQMSHELRTPLNAIMGYAQLLRRDSALSERQASGLATIHASGQHLLTLINDILDLARIEAGKLTLHPGVVDLANFMRVVVDIMRVKAEEKSLRFCYRAGAGLPEAVLMDDKRLRQVLLNLLGNAVKFTDRGRVELRLLALPPAADAAPGPAIARLRVEVEDSGIGMSDEQVARIFQPFEQVADMGRREGGTGLGLAISQQLIGLMGGRIEVATESGRGSLFWFTLALPLASAPLALAAPADTVIGYQGARKTVLVVDDVPQNRAMLMDTLDALGFAVADAANGEECLALLEQVRPDLIVMDVMMPVMDGVEATRRIRASARFGSVPVIVVTASAAREDELKSLAAGANAFLAKPIEHDALLAAIGAVLSLQWIGAGSAAAPAPAGPQEAALVAPPASEIATLRQLARLGNMQKISERADYLLALDARYAQFARRLRELARDYQSQAIAALVERYGSEPAAASGDPEPASPAS
ncbi:MAG: response regulator, partial [Massilia sp.]